MGCQVAYVTASAERLLPFGAGGFEVGRESSVVAAGKWPWSDWHVAHLIFRGHTPGHSGDQLLQDWMKSGGTTVSFCPLLRMYRHMSAVLNRIVMRLGSRGRGFKSCQPDQMRFPQFTGLREPLFTHVGRSTSVLDPLTRPILGTPSLAVSAAHPVCRASVQGPLTRLFHRPLRTVFAGQMAVRRKSDVS
jgi:hypothetical protein